MAESSQKHLRINTQSEQNDEVPQVVVHQPAVSPLDNKKSRINSLKIPSTRGNDATSTSNSSSVTGILHRRGTFGLKKEKKEKKERHIQIDAPPRRSSPANLGSIYLGSFAPTTSAGNSRPGSIRSSRRPSTSGTPRHSMSASEVQLENLAYLLRDVEDDLERYGIEENRDGFFDADFHKPAKMDKKELLELAQYTLPLSFRKRHPLSIKQFLPKQWEELKHLAVKVTTTRSGVLLLKSFLGFFIPYILCLIGPTGKWLGRYSYIMVLSAVFNHPGRSIGSQLDGTVQTISGTATGLGWGAFALWVSSSTSIAERGYGGILAAFLIIFMGLMAALRSYFMRLYQFTLPAGIAAMFTCMAETGRDVTWEKLLDYGVPWVLGQALCLIIALTVFPDGGARQIAMTLHDSFRAMQGGLVLPRKENRQLHRLLSFTFIKLSQASRDLSLDVSFSRFPPKAVRELRNGMQAVIRSLLSIKIETRLFEKLESGGGSDTDTDSDSVLDIDNAPPPRKLRRSQTEDATVELVQDWLAEPTRILIKREQEALARCDAVLLGMAGYRRYLGPPPDVSSDLVGGLISLRKAMIKFDEMHEGLLNHENFPTTYSNYPEVIQLFLFINPIRQTALTIESLVVLVNRMQQRNYSWRFYLPSYPFLKSLDRTNAQVRHDRGSLTTGLFFRTQKQLKELMRGAARSTFQPVPRQRRTSMSVPRSYSPDSNKDLKDDDPDFSDSDEDVLLDSKTDPRKTARYRLWKILHRMQGFEMRFALKVIIVTSLLAVPAWLPQSRGWYNRYQSWWAVIVVWLMIHPRAGGNIQDAFTRSLCAALGALWGGLAYAARDGNRYVMAVFAAIYMIPMMYRFTQSTHPRSGLIGCISFLVVSLTAQIRDDTVSVTTTAWAHGVAFIIGTLSAMFISWVLWPFIARHELRKSLAAMIYYCALIYRGVVAKYIYYDNGDEPTAEDVERSEKIEGRLREGFVRLRHLLGLTRHELRLREPFNPLPYSALIEACDSFFEHLVEVRQFSLYFQPHYMAQNPEACQALLNYRRDAVAAILMNLYILAGALRGGRKVPRYLPSAAAARKRLLAKMAEVELEDAEARRDTRTLYVRDLAEKAGRGDEGKRALRFADVYQFAYSKGLTQCVEELEQLQRYTKIICGEIGFFEVEQLGPGEESDEAATMFASRV